MLSYLANYDSFWGPLRLFGYISFRSVSAIITALLIGYIIAPRLLKVLYSLKVAQSFRTAEEVGKLAELHASKKNTPTMGGLIIYFSVTLTTTLWAKPNIYVSVALLVYTGLTFIGFLDDYLKVSKKNSKGLKSIWKLLGQGFLTLLAIGLLLGNVDTHGLMSELWIPFYKHPFILEMPIWFIFVFFFFVMSGTSNAINLTDGVDGLAIGCTIPVVLVYAIIAYATGNFIIAHYLNISFLPGTGELSIVCGGVIGAALAFLWYNAHPAEVFMGDTGSLGLGGLIGTVAFIVHEPFTLILIGGVFVLEAVSVILQIFSFKVFKRRIFRMAPIHHHFELKEWPETKVVIRFWILSFLFALAGLCTLKLR